MRKYFITLAIFLLGTIILFPQQTEAQKELLRRAENNHKLLETKPGDAFQEAVKIVEEAKKSNAQEAELRAMATQCTYFKMINDFENMMTTAESLFQRAKSHRMYVFQALAKSYLFDAYSFSGLPDKGFLQLEQGMKLINKTDGNEPLAIIVKAELFVAYSNYYELKDDNKNKLKFVKLAGKEFEKIPNEEYKQKLLYVHYSNLAGVYTEMNLLDSAKYYAELSISKEKGDKRYDIQFANLSTLGQVALKIGDYNNAISYFKKAEKIEGYKNHINVEILYNNIIEAYYKLNLNEEAGKYESKRDSLKLAVSENQNKSLHKLLIGKEKNNQWYTYAFTLSLIIMTVLMFFIIRKNRILSKQEKVSQEYLKKNPENQKGEDYSKLLEMLKKKDPAFMPYFDEVFPEFTQRLLKTNPKIIQSEIEFCALLKLKISTKDITRYRNITPKTAQNKKYLIRKKLSIPTETDIYHWFDNL